MEICIKSNRLRLLKGIMEASIHIGFEKNNLFKRSDMRCHIAISGIQFMPQIDKSKFYI